jgi:hypothetical protein
MNKFHGVNICDIKINFKCIKSQLKIKMNLNKNELWINQKYI